LRVQDAERPTTCVLTQSVGTRVRTSIQTDAMTSSRHHAFTLLELLLVVAIVGILVGVMLPSTQPAVYDQLRSTAQIVATDLAYARSLAVANNDNYRITFDLNANQYILKHSGTNAALDTLPKTPFSSAGDPADRHVVDLDNLPHAGPAVRLAAVAATGSSTVSVGDVEFGPLGQTTRTNPTTIWLMASGGSDRRYMTLVVSPVTGMTQVGGYSDSGPPTGVTQIQ
jgi:prepilin-type N-terminal cleavage/methylation domain-containing protein